jgi:SAM-dependent methyltransferase
MNSNLNAAIFHQGKKLTNNEVHNLSESCPICLDKGDRTPEFLLQSDPDVHLLLCHTCKGASASRMPTDEALEKYYGSYYKDDSKVTFHNIDRFANHIYQFIEGDIENTNELRILDYGGGDGSLGIALAKKLKSRYQKIYIDLVDYNVEKSFDDGQIIFNSYQDLKEISGTFNIILASAVLEHIPRLNQVMTKLYSMLSTSGFFYARTPYVVPFKKVIRQLDFTYPAHVHDLGPAFWNTFSKSLHFNWKIVVSRSSIVETQFGNAFFRTLLSYLFKSPSRLEEMFSGRVLLKPKWKYVGGWEILLKNI